MTHTLILGDCLEEMAKLPAASVDLILCDLPYGTTQNKWDSVIDLRALWAEYWRVARPNAIVALTAAQPFTSALVMSSIREFRYDWTWIKPHTGQLNAKRQPLRNKEDVLIFCRQVPPYNPQFGDGEPYTVNRSKYKGNPSYGAQVDHSTVSDGRRYPMQTIKFVEKMHKQHPTQKPVALMEYLIRTYSNEGDVVMDNCFGSCTTGIACLNTGRRFVGIERDPEYFRLGSERFRKREWEIAQEALLHD